MPPAIDAVAHQRLSQQEKQGLRDLSRDVASEWFDWENTLPPGVESYSVHDYPNPAAEHGLPKGWTIVARRDYPSRTSGVFDLSLIRRQTGGWVVVRYEPSAVEGYSRMVWVDVTLAHMYTDVTRAVAEETGSEKGRMQIVYDLLAPFLVGLFDDADPSEAKEKALFALSGILTYVPHTVR